MLKVLSITLFSMLSTMFCNLASAMSCSDIDSVVFDNEAESSSIFSACLDSGSQRDGQKDRHSSSHYFDSLDGHDEDSHDHIILKHEDNEKSAKADMWEHGIEWSSYLSGHDEFHIDESDGDDFDGFQMYDHENDEHHRYSHYHGGKDGKKHHLDISYQYHNAEAVVPVPAAIWLFGSGLYTLIIVSRRKS